MQLQTAVRHNCLAALRSRPLLPRFGRRGLRKRRTNCRSTCPVGWVSLQVDKSSVISSVHLHTSHLCEILHSIQQVTQAKRKESQQLQALFNILFMLLSYVALSGNFKLLPDIYAALQQQMSCVLYQCPPPLIRT